MNTEPTNQQIAKLPKWAQEHIEDLQRERDVAVRELNEWCDSQTKAPMFIDENVCTGENSGPSVKRRYVQGHRLGIEWQGVSLNIILAHNDSQRDNGIHLQWGVAREMSSRHVAMIPKSYQCVELVSKENMR